MTATTEMGRKAGPEIKGRPFRSMSSDIPDALTSAQTHVPRRPDASKAAPGSRSLQAPRSYSFAPRPRAASPPCEPRSRHSLQDLRAAPSSEPLGLTPTSFAFS